MGYNSSDIAHIAHPAEVSLSGLPNFIQFSANKNGKGEDRKTTFSITVNAEELPSYVSPGIMDDYPDTIENTDFTICETYNKGQNHTFIGTIKPAKADDKTYLLDADAAVTAQNIRACLMKNTFFRNRFAIDIPFRISGNGASNGATIELKSLGTGELYNFTLGENDLNKPLFIFEGPHAGTNNDPIDHGLGNTDIEVDVYSDTGLFLGVKDSPDAEIVPGKHLVTMSKSYFGQPVWFDINALTGTKKTYSDDFLYPPLASAKAGDIAPWTNTGTVNDYRLVAGIFNGTKRNVFYYSDPLYTITGYGRTLDKIDMTPYVYDDDPEAKEDQPSAFRPLTNQPVLPHVKGQAQYFNFILKDRKRGMPRSGRDYKLGIYYHLFTASGKGIARRVEFEKWRDLFYIVNTIRLDIDRVIEEVEATENKKVGFVKVYLSRNQYPVGEPLQFRIMPECLHTLKDFAFLNALGGWSSFNFEGERAQTVKSDTATIYKTQLPGYKKSDQIESVFDKEIKESFTVKTAPISAEVANWLKEMTASLAVYELFADGTVRYIVIDEFSIKHSSKDSLFVLEMKYHYSDTYNAVIK